MSSVKVTGVDSVISHLEEFSKGLDAVLPKAAEKLCERGKVVADAGYATALYSQANPGIETHCELTEDGCNLVATGTGLLYVEFGTSVNTEIHPLQYLVSARGTRGQGKGGQPSWGYYGEPGTNGRVIKSTKKGNVVLTHGDPPARAMYDASQIMREEAGIIIMEAINNG